MIAFWDDGLTKSERKSPFDGGAARHSNFAEISDGL